MSFFDSCYRWEHSSDIIYHSCQTVVWISVIYYFQKNIHHCVDTDKYQKRLYKLTFFEKLYTLLLSIVILMNIGVRVSKGVPHWMIQPCHVLSFYLLYVLLNTKSDARHFYAYFYSIWMPTVGILMPPHSSWFYWWWEPILFYVHHGMILLIPFYYLIWNHRFHSHFLHSTRNRNTLNYLVPSFTQLSSRLKYFLQIFTCGLLYHSTVLATAGLILDEDFDAMRCRFDGGEMLGDYWRETMIVTAIILSAVVSKIPDLITHSWYFSSSKNTNSNITNKK